jgi:MFS family permease
MNMAVAVFGAVMGQLYLMQKLGVTQAEASVVNSMLFLGSILGGPMIGWLSDRLRMRVLPMKAGVLISFFITLIILYTTVSLIGMGILFFLLGFFTAAQVISYAQVAESNAPSMTAMAVSTVSISTQGGYVLYQNLFSAFLSHHGGMHLVDGLPVYSLADYQSAAIILPLGLIIALLTMVGLKETHCRQNLG